MVTGSLRNSYIVCKVPLVLFPRSGAGDLGLLGDMELVVGIAVR